MTTVTASSKNRSASRSTIMKKKPLMVPVPIRNLDDLEILATGFKMHVLSCDEGDVSTHGGMGSQFAVSMNWKGKHCTIDAIELLAAWVRTWDEAEADAILKATIS